jgi:hypothetical protein
MLIMSVNNIINIAHVILTIFAVNYPLLFTKNKSRDTIYILLLFALLYSYILLQGECFISYAIKKYENPEYKLGSKISVLDEYKTVLFNNENIASLCILYILITLIFTSFIALTRNNFVSEKYVYLFSLFLLTYLFLVKMNNVTNILFYFNVVFFAYITFLLYFLIIKK